MSVQLSISLLASDRKETLKRCLDSLKPLMAEIPSELIVVFTGTDPQVCELAKQYTEQVIPFTWCDDFSAARNTGLKKASGEWFMFIDDDEWFEDTREIIQFFKSGEHKKYNSAAYVIRNYKDWSGTEYVDSMPKRMVKLTKQMHFRYAIHEELYPALEPSKYLKDFVHHYGYVENEIGENGEKPQKFERNVPLLLKELERDKKNKKLYLQLAQEYASNKDYKMAEEYCRQGVELIRKKREHTRIENWLLAYYPQMMALQNDLKRMLEESEYILEHDKPDNMLRGWLFAGAAKVCMPLRMYEKGLEYVRDFYKETVYLEKHEELQNEQAVLNVRYQALEDEKSNLLLRGLEYCLKLEDSDSLQEIMLCILEEKNKTEKNDYYGILDDWKKTNADKEEWIFACFEKIQSEDVYVEFQRALYAEKQNRLSDARILFEKCIAIMNPYLRYQLAFMAIRNEFEISRLIEHINLEVWDTYAQSMVRNIDIKQYDIFSEKIKRVLVTYPLYYAVIQRYLLERKMRETLVDGEELNGIVEEYAKSIVGYYKCIYKEELFQENMWFCLPDKCCFAILLVDALECEKRGKYKECMEYLRRAIHKDPEMGSVLKRLVKHIRELVDNPQTPQNEEFVKIGEQVKTSVRNLMAQGQYKEAFLIIEQLKTMLPNDREVISLRQEILRSMAERG